MLSSLSRICSATACSRHFDFRVLSRFVVLAVPAWFLPAWIPVHSVTILPEQHPPVSKQATAGQPTAPKTAGRDSEDDRGPESIPHYLETRYDQIAWLVTHNAMSNREEGWWFPNQSYGITRQLNDGVRGLMLDIHMIDDQPYLLHGRAILGKTPLLTGLTEIRTYMKKNPKAVLTLIFESYAPAPKVRKAFEEAGLLDFLHQQETPQPWPAIKDMIAADKRLIVFTDAGGGEWPGFHDVWKFCQETHFSVKQTSDFSYQRNRGKKSNPLFILNHFLTRPTASPGLASQANSPAILKPRLEGCQKATMRFPNYVAVDFYESGDTVTLLREFNRHAILARRSGQHRSDSHSDRVLEQK